MQLNPAISNSQQGKSFWVWNIGESKITELELVGYTEAIILLKNQCANQYNMTCTLYMYETRKLTYAVTKNILHQQCEEVWITVVFSLPE